MTVKKHSKSTIRGARRVRPAKAAVDTAALKSAARLVTIACDHENSPSTMDVGDRLELVSAAGKLVRGWFHADEAASPSDAVFEALGILELVAHALACTVEREFSNGICDPVQSGLDVAEKLLQQGIREPLDRELMARSSLPREAA
jgi:hypothetical protein